VFIWSVPGLTKPGGVCERPVDFMSIYPTLCDLTGVPKPAHVEGHNIRSLLKDPKAKWDHTAVTTFHKDNHSIRSETWRYIRYADGSEELYNHDTDPYEWTNLAKDPQYTSVKAELARFAPTVNAPERPSNAVAAKNKQAAEGKAKRGAAKRQR
jgi:arylsulfatase A-like enzyme